MFFKDSNFTKKNFLKNLFLVREPEIKFLKSSEQTKINISRKISEEEWESFFNRLTTARIEANLTQAQVAKSLGKYQSYISKIESGEKNCLWKILSDYTNFIINLPNIFVPYSLNKNLKITHNISTNPILSF
ncbi:DNA-binding helix-turn-helix domain protein [Leptospira interrogans str. L1207]|nr:DNA-binding helix-turn-helix domain protein [Leptospira interrogans str. L1207]